jgi:hypothetical protein
MLLRPRTIFWKGVGSPSAFSAFISSDLRRSPYA